MFITSLLSLIFDLNWILYSSYIEVAIFKKLTLGGIFGIANII